MKSRFDSHNSIASRRRGIVLSLLLGLAFGSALRAEQLRVAVVLPEVVADSDAARKELEGEAALCQSLLTTELARSELFSVVERENLAALVREWELKQNRRDAAADTRPLWLGADWILIGKLSRTNGQCELGFKVLDALHGGIEREGTNTFTAETIEKTVRKAASALHSPGRSVLARKNIHTLASVLDFDLQSPLERNRWCERAAARRLRGYLQQQPGVLVLEREEVEELLAETRLRRGGLTVGSSAATNIWSQLRHYQLVSGTITETQPEGKPLTLRVLTRIRDLDGGGAAEFTESFATEQWTDGMWRIEQRLKQLISGGNAGGTNGTATDRPVEALALADKAMRLSSSSEFNTFGAVVRLRPSCVLDEHTRSIIFTEGAMAFQKTPGRRAKLLLAIQYLKTAVLADDHNAQIKLVLASFLTDAQVNEHELAVSLAEETGWRFPEHRQAAWGLAYYQSSGERKKHFLRLLIEFFPDSGFARIPAAEAVAAFVEKHRHDPDLGVVVAAVRPGIDQALTEVRDGTFIEGPVLGLFDLTQITGRNPENRQKGHELQTPENRARGVALLEEMIQKHPRHAFFLCHFWAYYWDYRTDSETNISYWLKRAAEAVPDVPSDQWGMSVWWDAPRINLARRLMDRGDFKEAMPYLEKITNGHLIGERDFRIGRCAFELGDYERALKLFRAFGPDHKEASEWAAKCEKKLKLPSLQIPPKPYAIVTNRSRWTLCDVALSRAAETRSAAIRTLAADEDYLWIGLACPMIWSDHNLLQLEKDPRAKAYALRQGGLIRWNRRTGQTKLYTTAEGLPHPWVSALAATADGLWVGTLGGGVGLLNSRTGEWTVWTETNGLAMNWVQSFAVANDALWAGFGHFERGAAAQLSFRTREWRTFLPGDFPAQTNFPPAHIMNAAHLPESVKQPRVICYVPVTTVSTLALVEGRLWCSLPGSQRGPVNLGFEPHGTVVCDFATNGWHQVHAGAPSGIARVGNRVWLSFGTSGLANSDLRGGDWRNLTLADGLPMAPGEIHEWHGKLLMMAEGVMLFDPAGKTFEVFPCNEPGTTQAMALAGDTVYLARGGRLLMLRFENP